MDRLRRGKEVYTVVKDVREMYPTGWYGTVEGANVEKAQEFLDAVCARCVQQVTEALEALKSPAGAN